MRKEILRIIHGITPAYAGKREGPKNAQSKVGDHPRVCGEKCIPLTRGHGRQGSPPRMRGKVQLGEIDLQDIWITPAYAGKSGPCPDRVPPAGDHPRVCGEKSQSTSASPRALGSPPRMRGKGVKQSNSRIRMGITPAYAGKSLLKLLHHVGLRDHPRVCGEKAYSLVINGSEWGSPPRMRGKGTKRCSSRRGGRITPAYAGKSKRIAPSSVLFGDHPRVCGEKSFAADPGRSAWGSPPRMRGKDVSHCELLPRAGITPAYAGKSTKQEKHRDKARDHPRVCGEKSHCVLSLYVVLGSPPRMRGKATRQRPGVRRRRITPAYAGKSPPSGGFPPLSQDHPRVCGEK